MKNFLYPHFTIGLCLLGFSLSAQVEVDRQIQMTGGTGQRAITNLELPVNDNDAANKAYVDANSGGGGFTHYIGELFEGGIVVGVWMESGEEHGLITSLTDLSSASVWSNVNDVTIGITAQSLRNGQANTNAILGTPGHSSSAAKLCDDYSSGGYTDWYLPALWELHMCSNSAFTVNNVLGDVNGFQNGGYWSSTEDPNTAAWGKNFTTGATFYGYWYATQRVRAVRRF